MVQTLAARPAGTALAASATPPTAMNASRQVATSCGVNPYKVDASNLPSAIDNGMPITTRLRSGEGCLSGSSRPLVRAARPSPYARRFPPYVRETFFETPCIRTSSCPTKQARRVPLAAIGATSLLSGNNQMSKAADSRAYCPFSLNAVHKRAALQMHQPQ